ncbi:hypothetical protein LguiB_027966 [Lonicera macranthoides]
MDRLRPRERKIFSGFTEAEIEKMEKLLKEPGKQSADHEFCKKLTRNFNCSKGRAGKPILKWTEVQSWFEKRQQESHSKDNLLNASKKLPVVPEALPLIKENVSPQMPKGEKLPELSELQFEARSTKDGAWYDVDAFVSHRFLSSGEAEVRVRFVGYGSEEDEWVSVKNSVRERSLPLEHSECQKVKVRDVVLCFQERSDQARHYDACILEIQRKLHDVRGCRCLFLIRYQHDNTEERVRLKRLCCRATY